MIFVELARRLRTETLGGKLQHFQDHQAARSVRAHLVPNADRLAGSRGEVIQLDQPAFAGVVRLCARLVDARRAQPAVDTNFVVTHPTRMAEIRATSKRARNDSKSLRDRHATAKPARYSLVT